MEASMEEVIEQNKDGMDTFQVPWPSALNEIKDTAVMMKMAGRYICHANVVARIGDRMAEAVEALQRQLEEIKKLFVGKPLHDVDFSGPLADLEKIASQLKEPAPETLERCKTGDLGTYLSEKTAQLATLTREVIRKIEGRDLVYKQTEAILTGLKRLRFLLHSFVTTYKILTRVIAAVVLLILVTFVALFATLETETEIMARITQNRADIRAAQAALSRVEDQLAQLNSKMRELEKLELDREEKIKILEMSVQAHQLKEKREKLQFQIHQKQKALEENMKKIEEIRHKSLLARMLRL